MTLVSYSYVMQLISFSFHLSLHWQLWKCMHGLIKAFPYDSFKHCLDNLLESPIKVNVTFDGALKSERKLLLKASFSKVPNMFTHIKKGKKQRIKSTESV